MIIASLNESTLNGYEVGFPVDGFWVERLNSDYSDNRPNSWVAGNGGGVWADRGPRHDMPASAALTIPANSILVFTR